MNELNKVKMSNEKEGVKENSFYNDNNSSVYTESNTTLLTEIKNPKEVYIKSQDVWSMNEKDIPDDELIYLIKAYNNLEYYEVSYELSIKLIKHKKYIFNNEYEQKILLAGFKNYIEAFIKSWKNLMNYKTIYINDKSNLIHVDLEDDFNDSSYSKTTKYNSVSVNNPMSIMINQKILDLEETIQVKCMEIVAEIEKMIDKSKDDRSRLYFNKKKADMIHFYCKVANEEEFAILADECEKIYQSCFDQSFNVLDEKDYLYLSIAFHYSIFCSEILDNIDDAYTISNKAYLRAKNLDVALMTQEFKTYKALLEKKLVIWKTDFIDIV